MAAAVHLFTEALEATIAQLFMAQAAGAKQPQAQLLERLECKASL
jgi:hypothetical protein